MSFPAKPSAQSAPPSKYKNIITAESDGDIRKSILHYDDTVRDMPKIFISHNAKFVENIERLAMELVK